MLVNLVFTKTCTVESYDSKPHSLVQIQTTQQENSIQPRGLSALVKSTEPTQMDSPTPTVIAYHLDVTDGSNAADE